jgi:hypothetical protein
LGFGYRASLLAVDRVEPVHPEALEIHQVKTS